MIQSLVNCDLSVSVSSSFVIQQTLEISEEFQTPKHSANLKRMAPRNKENGGSRPQKGAKNSKHISFADTESSEEDYRKKRDKNNQVSPRTCSSRAIL